MSFENKGNGYNGYSMSNNAIAAYSKGEMPLSKWTKEDIIDGAKNALKGTQTKFSFETLKKAKLSTLRDMLLEKTCEHHTSSYFNSTSFYQIKESVFENLTDDKINQWISFDEEEDKKIKEKKSLIKIEFVAGTYGEWEGSKSHPHLVDYEFVGIQKENEITVIDSFRIVHKQKENNFISKIKANRKNIFITFRSDRVNKKVKELFADNFYKAVSCKKNLSK